jgi:hypothetical protein
MLVSNGGPYRCFSGVGCGDQVLYTVMPRLILLYVKPPRIRIGGTGISILRVACLKLVTVPRLLGVLYLLLLLQYTYSVICLPCNSP